MKDSSSQNSAALQARVRRATVYGAATVHLVRRLEIPSLCEKRLGRENEIRGVHCSGSRATLLGRRLVRPEASGSSFAYISLPKRGYETSCMRLRVRSCDCNLQPSKLLVTDYHTDEAAWLSALVPQPG